VLFPTAHPRKLKHYILRVILFSWTRERWLQYHLYTAVLGENAFWLVQRNRNTAR